ncbi:uncharacterized protein LOC134231216 [Saccostrea cucullata]|uniref:uncharacterized protein LOC134231216 n=1 Tax=Saccostrea cuccullata TaxID=36930 RepID=UPI002ED60863
MIATFQRVQKCVMSEKHKRHHITSVQDLVNSNNEGIEKEKKRLQETVYSKLEERVSDIETQLEEIDGKYEKLTSEVSQHGEEWRRKVEIAIQKNKDKINKMRIQHRDTLNKNLDDTKKLIADIKLYISEIEDILKSKEVSKSLSYETEAEKFTHLPSNSKVEVPVFTENVNPDQCSHLFGSLSSLSITTEENGQTTKTEAVSSPRMTQLLEEPQLITSINTGNEYLLHSVTCLNDDEIWTGGSDNIMKLYNLQGKLLKSIRTKSGKSARDIEVTRRGDLVYSDPDTKTVNIVKNEQIQDVIRKQGWKPYNVCITSSEDILVSMVSENGEQAKGTFGPVGITTDSQSQILTADCDNNCIHILDQEGQFLSFIDNGLLKPPWDLCVNTRGNVFVVECCNGNVKKIRYM